MKLEILFLATFFTLLSACSSTKAVPVTPVIAVEMTQEEAGKMIYEANCANCHSLYPVASFTEAEWEPLVYNMQKNANLSDDEIKIVLDYLKKNAKQ